MKKATLLITIFSFYFTASSQTYVFQDGNSRFQTLASFEENDSTVLWDFKDDLSKGKYWVVEQTKCGADTMKYAEFIAKGIKHGTWTEWNSALCFGKRKKNSSEIDQWVFASDKIKAKETIYNNGFIVKSTLFHTGSKEALWEHIFPPKATKESDWIEEKTWSNRGVLKWDTKILMDGSTSHQGFYSNGQIKIRGVSARNGTFKGDWIYYYENGQIMAKGEFEPIKARFNDVWKIPNRFWQYWDEEGKLIADVTFKKGKAIKIKRHQSKDIPIASVNEMLKNNLSYLEALSSLSRNN